MALKRSLLRLELNNLSESAQQSFVNEYFEKFDGDSLGGVMVVNSGWGWIDTEGDETKVDARISELENDERVSSVTEAKEGNPSSRSFPDLKSHYEADVYRNT